MSDICCLCGKGHVAYKIEHNFFTYKHITDVVPSHFYECGDCCGTYLTPHQSKLNKLLFIEFKKTIDNNYE